MRKSPAQCNRPSPDKHKSKYDFIQWYKLSLSIRVDLIPVIEGIRHGATIDVGEDDDKSEHTLSKRRLLEYCLKRFGLFYKKQGESSYYICDNNATLEKLWHNQLCIGEFLGYPKCCVDAFNKAVQNINGMPAVVFCRKLSKVYKKRGFENPLFFTLHVPCSINCKETLALGEKIQKALNDNDKEVAKYLVKDTLNCMYEFSFYYPAKNIKK